MKHVINKREIIENYIFRLCNCYVIKTIKHSNMYEIIKFTTHVKNQVK